MSLLFMCGAFLTAAEASGVYPRDIPVVTDEPDNVTVVENTPASFTITATGTEPLTYAWQKNGVDIPSTNAATYNISAAVYADSGKTYRCIVSNSEGADTSLSATLTVILVPPEITTHPSNQIVTEGATTSFTVAANGTNLHYKWQKTQVDIPGAPDNATYTTPATVMGDNGLKFRCIVSNSGGSVTSNEATLGVTPAPPVITEDLRDTVINERLRVTFRAKAIGTRPLTFKWYKNDTIISSAVADTFRTGLLSALDSNSTYKYIVSNSVGADTSKAVIVHVTMLPPSISTQPRNDTAVEGQAASFRVIATGTSIHYKWQRDHVDITGAPDSATYRIQSVTLNDNGAVFNCVVSNAAGSVTSDSAILVVTKEPPTIVVQPSPDTVKIGETASFKISVTSMHPPLSFQWQIRKTTDTAYNNINGANDSVYITPPATESDDSTRFRCVVSDSAGSRTSSAVRLIILFDPPLIISDPTDQKGKVGDTLIYKVSVTGNKLRFQWYRDTITNAGSITNARDSIYKKVVTITDSSRRKFCCIVSNSGGKDTSAFAKLIFENTSINELVKLKKSSTVFQIGPNPSSDVIYFKYLRTDQQKGMLVIFDAVGNKVYEKECFLNPGSRSFLTIDLKNTLGRKLGSGTYLAVLKVKNGKGMTEAFVQQIGVKIKK